MIFVGLALCMTALVIMGTIYNDLPDLDLRRWMAASASWWTGLFLLMFGLAAAGARGIHL